jgi:bifunctional N-acetylglutamate synthase/kinase
MLHGPALRTELPIPAKAGFGMPLQEPGHRLLVEDGFAGLDQARLRTLIERSFGRKLAETYFDSPAGKIILEAGYLGAAVIKDIHGVPYLDKFVVDPDAQGNGLGRAIWKLIKTHNESLLWRASSSNHCNCWYERNSDGSQKIGQWNVYWYNLDHETAGTLAPLAAALPKTILG